MGWGTTWFWNKEMDSNNTVMEFWLALLVDEVDREEDRPEWLLRAREDWEIQAAGNWGGGCSAWLADVSDEERRQRVLALAERALARMLTLGEPIPGQVFNSVYRGPAAGTSDVPGGPFVDVAHRFITMLQEASLEEIPFVPGDSSSSTIRFRNRQMDVNDCVLDYWSETFRLAMGWVEEPSPRSVLAWLIGPAAHWVPVVDAESGSGTLLWLELFVKDEERRQVVLALAEEALAILRTRGDPLWVHGRRAGSSEMVRAAAFLQAGTDFIAMVRDATLAGTGEDPG